MECWKKIIKLNRQLPLKHWFVHNFPHRNNLLHFQKHFPNFLHIVSNCTNTEVSRWECMKNWFCSILLKQTRSLNMWMRRWIEVKDFFLYIWKFLKLLKLLLKLFSIATSTETCQNKFLSLTFKIKKPECIFSRFSKSSSLCGE